MIEKESIEVLESNVIRYKDVSISISGSPEGVLSGKTTEQMILYCSDILRQSIAEPSLEESIDIPKALRDTLKVNYNWSDIDFNNLITLWRKNLYLMKVGEDNGSPVDIEEYNKFLLYLEKKRKQEAGEMSVGATSDTAIEEFAAEAQAVQNIIDNESNVGDAPKVFIEGQEFEVLETQEKNYSSNPVKKVEKKSKTK